MARKTAVLIQPNIRRMREIQKQEWSHADFIRALANPYQGTNKKDIPMLFFGEIHEQGIVNQSGVISHSALVYDIEHCPVEYVDAEQLIKSLPFRAYLHTSFNHRTLQDDGSIDNRYRVVIPLEIPIRNAQSFDQESQRIAETYLPLFRPEHLDPKSFVWVQRWFMPAKKPNSDCYAFCWSDAETLLAIDTGKELIQEQLIPAHDHTPESVKTTPNKAIQGSPNRSTRMARRNHTPESVRKRTAIKYRTREPEPENYTDPRTYDDPKGAFNRRFTIPEALQEFNVDHYQPTDNPFVWAYKDGTGEPGLKILPDKPYLAFSHHSSDPLARNKAGEQKPLNAFEIVLEKGRDKDGNLFAEQSQPFISFALYLEQEYGIPNLIGKRKKAGQPETHRNEPEPTAGGETAANKKHCADIDLPPFLETAVSLQIGKFEQFTALNKPQPIPTGFEALDDALGKGIRPAVYVVGGQPGTGKTSLILQIADGIAWSGVPVIFYSLEMTPEDLMLKSYSRISRGTGNKPAANAITPKELLFETNWKKAKKDHLRKSLAEYAQVVAPNLYFVRGFEGKDLESVSKEVRQAVKYVEQKTGKTPVVFVDYLQYLNLGLGQTEARFEVDYLVRQFKEIKHTTQAPIILLSSLNRSSDNQRPTMKDFKESSGIEYTADVAIVLTAAEHGTGTTLGDEVCMHVLKNRFGSLGMIRFSFEKPYGYFEQISNAIERY